MLNASDNSIAQESESVNRKFSDIKSQDRESIEDSFSNRALLANALEGVAANEVEQKRLAEYKGMVATLDRESFKLSKINAEIKELTFGKGEKNPKRLKELREEATKTATKIVAMDFSAPTNNVPSMLMPAMFGTSNAKMVPKIIPPNIRSIRLLLVHS